MAVGQKKRSIGRPTDYDPRKHPKLVEDFCAKYGVIDEDLAKLCGIHVSNFYKWQKVNPEFREALQKGKDEWNSDRAENSLVKRVIGYSYDETTQELVNGEMVVTKIVTKSVAPDPASIFIFLKNRRPDRWRDKHEIDTAVAVTVVKPGVVSKPSSAGLSDE